MTAATPIDATLSSRPPHLFDDDFGTYSGIVSALAQDWEKTAVARDRAGGTASAQRQQLRDSGLLTLSIPRELGGHGEAWPLIYRIVRRLAAADSSLAHLFGFQHLQIATILLFGSPAQRQNLLQQTVAARWFWGNATNPLDREVHLTTAGDHYQLDGRKTFCSGAVEADALTVSVPDPVDPQRRLLLALPMPRIGITVGADWDAIGQRQTDSGSVVFSAVPIDGEEILGPPGADGSPRATLRPCISQLVLTEIYLGNSEGALASAWHYLHGEARPWSTSGVNSALDDPFQHYRFGEFWTAHRAAVLLAEHAAGALQAAWQRGTALTAAERGSVAIAIAQARAFAARTALEITAGIFDAMGARATAARLGFDRYWRNVRVHTLHDPLDYKWKDIGDFVVNARVPRASLYA